MKRLWRGLGVAAILAVVTGCAANPKYIAGSTGRDGTIKFLYVQPSGVQGVISCNRAEDGKLSDCRKVKVVLEGE